MQNGKMTHDEAVALLRKLSSDDVFRAQFEKDPATALKQIGMAAADVDASPSSALSPAPLPPKEQFREALGQILESGASDHICMVFPFLKLTYGDAGGTKRS